MKKSVFYVTSIFAIALSLSGCSGNSRGANSSNNPGAEKPKQKANAEKPGKPSDFNVKNVTSASVIMTVEKVSQNILVLKTKDSEIYTVALPNSSEKVALQLDMKDKMNQSYTNGSSVSCESVVSQRCEQYKLNLKLAETKDRTVEMNVHIKRGLNLDAKGTPAGLMNLTRVKVQEGDDSAKFIQMTAYTDSKDNSEVSVLKEFTTNKNENYQYAASKQYVAKNEFITDAFDVIYVNLKNNQISGQIVVKNGFLDFKAVTNDPKRL